MPSGAAGGETEAEATTEKQVSPKEKRVGKKKEKPVNGARSEVSARSEAVSATRREQGGISV